MKKIMIVLMIFMTGTVVFAQDRGQYNDDRPVIQLALLLDTSNSMDGLINQAKSQLWKIVSQTARERRGGQEAILQVALYEYGNDNLSVLNGYVRQVVPFTTDLDYLSQQLFELNTYGGSEYCGKVMLSAGRQLDWNDDPYTLKLMFIAGNEPFDQGPVDYLRAARSVMGKDIVVNTIFCGDYEEGQYSNWENGAQITGGNYMNINSDYEQVYHHAPQDDRIEELNRDLNNTYLGYGAAGQEKKERQMSQDDNAQSLSMGSLLERAKVKSSSSYSNSEWDLVDAYAEGVMPVQEMEAEDLPPIMQDMSDREREEYIIAMQEERMALQEEISSLSAERDLYLQEMTVSESKESTLDSAMIQAIREAAEKKGFSSDDVE